MASTNLSPSFCLCFHCAYRTVLTFSIIFCEVVAIYGVIMSIVFTSKVNGNAENPFTTGNYYTGEPLASSPLTLRLCNLLGRHRCRPVQPVLRCVRRHHRFHGCHR